MKNILSFLAVFFLAQFCFVSPTFAQLTTVQGGTGTSSPSGILYGDGTLHMKTVKIGSNLLFSSGILSSIASAGKVSTSTNETAGFLSYWTSTNATPALLGKVATSSFIIDSPLTSSGTAGALVGGSGFHFSIQQANTSQAGYLSSTDWNTFNSKISSVVADSPLSGSGTSASHLVLSTAGTWTGNAGSATKLATARAINGVDFDGTAAITITAASSTLLGDRNTFSLLQKFTNATSTLFSSSYASSTKWYGGGLTTCNGATSALTWAAGVYGCHTISAGTGTVTNVATTYPILGGPITTTGTLSLAFGTTTSNTWAGTQTFTNTANFNKLTNNGNATTTSLTVTGITGIAVFNGSTKPANVYGGTSCTNQFVRSLNGSGVATCATVGASDVSLANLTATDSTLTFSGTYNGSTARTIGLNLGNANSWTAKQTFTAASTTDLSASTYFGFPTVTAAPSFTVSGQAVINTNSAASSSLSFGDGTANHNIFATISAGGVFSSSTLAYMGKFGASGTTTIRLPYNIHKIKVTQISCYTDVGTAWIGLGTGAASTTQAQCSATGIAKAISANNVFNGTSKVLLDIGHNASAPNTISVTVTYENQN